MNGTFFALAFSTVRNPKLFAFDLILIARRKGTLLEDSVDVAVCGLMLGGRRP
jgi:hypothetical protein